MQAGVPTAGSAESCYHLHDLREHRNGLQRLRYLTGCDSFCNKLSKRGILWSERPSSNGQVVPVANQATGMAGYHAINSVH